MPDVFAHFESGTKQLPLKSTILLGNPSHKHSLSDH